MVVVIVNSSMLSLFQNVCLLDLHALNYPYLASSFIYPLQTVFRCTQNLVFKIAIWTLQKQTRSETYV